MFVRQFVHDVTDVGPPFFPFLVGRRIVVDVSRGGVPCLVDEMLNPGDRAKVVVDLVCGNRTQPPPEIADFGCRVGCSADQCEHRFTDDVFGQVLVSADADVNEPPDRREPALVELLDRRRILIAKTLDQIVFGQDGPHSVEC